MDRFRMPRPLPPPGSSSRIGGDLERRRRGPSVRAAVLAAALAGGFLAAAGPTPAARAQDAGGTPDTDVGGANPRVTTRADVQLRIDSGAGVDSERLAAWAQAVGDRAGAVRDCYGRRIVDAPEVEGRLRVAAALRPGRRRPELEVKDDGLGDRTLARCALRAISQARVDGVEHPETVFVELSFRHSHAAASRAARARAAEARAELEATFAVDVGPDGRHRASGASGNGLVGYEAVASTADDARRLATLAHRRLPGLFDCRRRAGRFRSPAGRLRLDLAVDDRGRIRARLRRSTVPDPQAGSCAVDAFRRRPIVDPAVEGAGALEGTLTVAFLEPGAEAATSDPPDRDAVTPASSRPTAPAPPR